MGESNNLHFHYDQLTGSEREAVDEAYQDYHSYMAELGVPVIGDDNAERVVDMMAKQVIASRKYNLK